MRLLESTETHSMYSRYVKYGTVDFILWKIPGSYKHLYFSCSDILLSCHFRQFALLNQYGTFVTLRKYPKFVLIKQNILGDKIKLEASGMPDLYLPLNMQKSDGDHLADVT